MKLKHLVSVINLFCLTALLAFVSLGPPALAGTMMEDPEPRIPKRVDAKSEEREVIEANNFGDEVIPRRHVKQNQEETDPIFYDATTSPAEMNPAGE